MLGMFNPEKARMWEEFQAQRPIDMGKAQMNDMYASYEPVARSAGMGGMEMGKQGGRIAGLGAGIKKWGGRAINLGGGLLNTAFMGSMVLGGLGGGGGGGQPSGGIEVPPVYLDDQTRKALMEQQEMRNLANYQSMVYR